MNLYPFNAPEAFTLKPLFTCTTGGKLHAPPQPPWAKMTETILRSPPDINAKALWVNKKKIFAKDTVTATRAEPVSNHQPPRLLDHPLGLPSRGPAASLHTEAAEEITYFIDEDVNNLSFFYM